jgi:hypothetical protein
MFSSEKLCQEFGVNYVFRGCKVFKKELLKKYFPLKCNIVVFIT